MKDLINYLEENSQDKEKAIQDFISLITGDEN